MIEQNATPGQPLEHKVGTAEPKTEEHKTETRTETHHEQEPAKDIEVKTETKTER